MPSRNNRDNINKSKFMSDDIQELRLIQINVDKTKKDVADISTYAQKEISIITNAIEKAIGKLDELNKKSKGSYERMSQEDKKQFQQQMRYVRTLDSERQKSLNNAIKAEEKLANQQKEGHKELAQAYLKEYDNNRSMELAKESYQFNAMRQAASGNIRGSISTMFNGRQNIKSMEIKQGEASLRERFSSGDITQKEFLDGMSNFTKQSRGLTAASLKFEAASGIFDAAVKVIKGFADIWIKRFENGLNKVADTYEALYQKQAVLSGINERQYQQAQKDMRDNIKQMGLDDNLAVTEVMNETSDYISKGITDFGKASQMGQLSAINKVLAPYLDMQSDAMTSLELAMPGISKSMAGIGKYVSDTVGQNRFTQKNLQNLIELTEPVSLAAKKDLLGEEGLAMIEDLVSKGMDMQTATQMATDIAGAVADPLKALQGDNVALASAIAAGKRDFTGIAEYAMGTERQIMKGTDRDLGSAAALQGAGLWGVYNFDFDKNFGEVIDNLNSGKYRQTNSTKTYNDLVTKFSNGDLTTAKQEKDILAENLSVDLAIYKERWPDLYQVIRELGSTIVKALAMYLGAKALGGLLGKGGGGSGLISTIGAGLTKFAGTGVGYNLMGSGAALGINNVAAATAAGAAGVVGGGAMAVKGGIDVYNDFKNNDVTWKTGASAAGAAGGAVGAGALLALGASNPVGWVALAVGGIALGARAVGEAMEKEAKSRETAMNTYQKQIDEEIKQREISQDKQIRSLEVLKTQVEKTSDVEKAKQLLEEAGIATKEELQKAEYNNKDALVALTNQYIASTKTHNEEDNKALKGLKEMDAKVKSDYADSTSDYLDWIVEGAGNKKMYKLTDNERALSNETVAAIAKYGEKNYDSLDKNEKKIYDKIKSYGIENAKNGNLSWENIDDIMNTMDNNKSEMRTLVKNALGDSEILQDFTTNRTAMNRLGNKAVYLNIDWQSAFDNYLSPATQNGVTDEQARSYLDKFKAATFTSSLDEISNGEAKKYIQNIIDSHNLGSYAIGSDYIPADGLSYLHEGEAVLTKSAADVLRSNTRFNASSVYGVSDAIQNGSTLNKQGFNLIVNAIHDQTAQLIAKMDQILAAVTQNKYTPKYNSKLVNLEGGVN